MKFNSPLLFLLITLFLLSCVSCSNKRSYKNSSRATGWKLLARKGGFQNNYNQKAKEQQTGPGLVFIEGGTFTMGKVQDDPMHDWNNSPNQQHVQSFYIDESEVTNLMYHEYLDWLKTIFPPEIENYKNIYKGALPDTLVWRNRLGNSEVMTNNYLRHPAYSEYPVVGVSWIQAVEYCNWRTDRVNELILEDERITLRNAKYETKVGETFFTDTYLMSPQSVYGGRDSVTLGGKLSSKLIKIKNDTTGITKKRMKIYVQRKDGILLPDYRLPTEVEWEYAALGLVGLRSYNSYRGRKKYPWDGQYTRSGKRKSKGDQLANFKQGDGDYGGIAGWSDDGADITAQIKSYEPNDYGLYDMAGNVAEWVADVYRPIVDDEYNDFNYYRGNVYTKNYLDKDGKVKIISADSIFYDTLSNGKIIARNLPGEVLKVPVDENETYLRINFSTSNNIDYRDGDKRSTRYSQTIGGNDTKDDVSGEKRMYNSPKHNTSINSEGKIEKQYDKSSRRTTLINNQVRVYKGGSWKDRDYWLDPAQRRFYPEDMATDYIGFRCAMSRVGGKTQKGKGKRPRN